MNNLNLPWKISAGSSCGRRALIADSTLVNIVESINDDIANHIVASVNLCNGNPDLVRRKLELYEKQKTFLQNLHNLLCNMPEWFYENKMNEELEELRYAAESIEKEGE